MLPTPIKKTRFRSPAPTLTRWRLALGLAVLVATIGGSFLVPRSATAQERRNPDDNLQVLLRGTQRAKTIANIPAAFVAAVKREYESSAELQRETKFEPYLANRYFWAIENLELTEGRTRIPTKRPVTMCTDGLCDAPLNPNIWQGSWTGGNPPNISNANLPIAAWTSGLVPNNNSISDTLCGPHASQAHHSIVPNGNDPVISSLKTVAPNPTSGNVASLRLGNRCINFGGDRVQKTFTVAANQTTLQFWYASVFQDPGHDALDQPGFGVYLLQSNGSLVNGVVDIDKTNPGKQNFIVANRNNPFFGYNQSLGVVYTGWNCVTIDLSGYVGQTLTLILVNRDCGQGGHWGYTYLDSFCLGCSGDPTGDASFNQARSDCSKGQVCFDYTVPKMQNGTTGQVNLSLALYQNGVLMNTLTSGPLTTNGTYCFTNVTAGLATSAGGFDWQATANFTATGATISPIVIGKTGEGFVPDKNNDCLFPPKEIDPCCPPWNKDVMKDTLFYHGSGSISSPYTLHFVSNNSLNNAMQGYIDYLHAVNPGITSFTLDWQLLNSSNTVISNPAFTTWTAGGGGNPSISGDLNFFSQPNAFPMQVGQWYRIRTMAHLNPGQKFFPEKCIITELWVRIQVLPLRMRSGQPPELEISEDQRTVIQRIPLGPERTSPISRPKR